MVGKKEPKNPFIYGTLPLFPWKPCFVRNNYYPKFECSHLILCFLLTCPSFLIFAPFHSFSTPTLCFNSVIIGKKQYVDLME